MTILRTMLLKMMNWMMADYQNASRLRKLMISTVMHHFPGQITCKEFGDFMGAYFDGELPDKQRRLFEFHLDACPMCRSHMNAYRASIAVLKASREDAINVPQELINAVLSARDHDPKDQA